MRTEKDVLAFYKEILQPHHPSDSRDSISVFNLKTILQQLSPEDIQIYKDQWEKGLKTFKAPAKTIHKPSSEETKQTRESSNSSIPKRPALKHQTNTHITSPPSTSTPTSTHASSSKRDDIDDIFVEIAKKYGITELETHHDVEDFVLWLARLPGSVFPKIAANNNPSRHQINDALKLLSQELL